jgi:hypothetical protein
VAAVRALRQVRPGEAGRPARQDAQVHHLGEFDVFGVDLQDGLALVQVGEMDDDLAVEPPGPAKGGVQDVRPVGGPDDDDL